MRSKRVRSNLLTQNCALLAVELAQMAGVSIEARLSATGLIHTLLPSFPGINHLFHLIFDPLCATKTPGLAKRRLVYMSHILLKPTQIIVTTLLNIVLLGLGSTKSKPQSGQEYFGGKFRRLSALIQSPKDLYSSCIGYHTLLLIKWQDIQKTTCRYSYKNPSMNILPERSCQSPKTLLF